jgi:TNF receptor-associated factor 2
MTKDITTNDNELTRLDDGIFQCNNQMTIFSEQLNDAQIELSLEKAQIDAISTNQNTLKQDVTTLKQQIENDNKIVKQEPDGTMVWKINNVREKMYDAQSERQTSVYSPPFYTSISGYKVCVRLYLNGDGSARGTYMSVFLVILRGPYDSLLKWPFSYRVSFCLYDQRTIIEKNGKMQPKHIIESFRPDTNSISFKQPCSAMNIASGIPKFCPLSEISELTNDNLYIVNDTMYIKTLIDFVEMPRSMLPFIFNINIAFPLHIQQKLISDEMKRLDEQNNN